MNGVLAFQSTADLRSELVWLDAQGREEATLPGIKYRVQPSRPMAVC